MTLTVRGVKFEDAYKKDDFEFPEDYEIGVEENRESIVGVDVETDEEDMRLLNHSGGSMVLLYLDDKFSDTSKEHISNEVMKAVTEFIGETVLFGDVDKVGYLFRDKLTDYPVAVIRDANEYDWNDTMTLDEVLAQYGIYEGWDGILYDEFGCPLPDQWD